MIRLGICLLVVCAAAFSKDRLDINRLYSLPWVIGTTPKDFTWSSDSRTLAFLWNDEGTNFYDLWIADRQTRKPVRITHMPRPELPANPGMDIQKLQQVEKAETDAGVSSVTWSQQHLLFVFKGELYRVDPGSEPGLLAKATHVTAVKAAAMGDKIAFVSSSDLFVSDSKGGNTKNLTSLKKPQVNLKTFTGLMTAKHWHSLNLMKARCRCVAFPTTSATRPICGK